MDTENTTSAETVTPISLVTSGRYTIRVSIPLPVTSKPLHSHSPSQLVLLERVRQSTFTYLAEYFGSFKGFSVTPVITGDKNRSCSALEIRTQEIDQDVLTKVIESTALFTLDVEIKQIDPDWRDCM